MVLLWKVVLEELCRVTPGQGVLPILSALCDITELLFVTSETSRSSEE